MKQSDEEAVAFAVSAEPTYPPSASSTKKKPQIPKYPTNKVARPTRFDAGQTSSSNA